MKLTDLYNEVARRADTEGTKINVAVTKRVLACMFEVLNEQQTSLALDLVSKGISAAAKKKKS